MSKIFIIGLPRTGTTSISVAFLEAGFKVAHTAYTQAAFELADVISDAPCFADFKELDHLFPGSTFIYLQRELSQWLPSIQRLLIKMTPHLHPKSGHFNPVLKRAFNETFLFSEQTLLSDQHLAMCYQKHQQDVKKYFKTRNNFIEIDISKKGSLSHLFTFLNLPHEKEQLFPHLNQGAQVANWKAYKHPNKINSLSSGIKHRQFFDYKKSIS